MAGLDAVVVGSGPNGLAAAVTMARAGLAVEVLEGAQTPGGGCRTEELTLPGFLHDVCSAVHPLVAISPFFQHFDLDGKGVKLAEPPVALAHPLDSGRAAFVVRSVEQTARSLGEDASNYAKLVAPLARDMDHIAATFLAPIRSFPSHPLAMARFALNGVMSAHALVRRFRTEEARAIFAGNAAHAMLPLDRPLTSAYALLFTAMAHATGWPVVQGGSSRIVDALVEELESLGGRIVTGRWVKTLGDLPESGIVMLDTSTKLLLELAGDRLTGLYRRSLGRYRYGPGVCKVDWALDGPVPWQAEPCRQAGTVHLGGTFEEIARSESEVAAGRHPQRPFCLVAQPDLVDATRAPGGRRTLWAYCHVPSGSALDMTERIEAQIERFAPGFRDQVLARATRTAVEIETHDPNYVGGDVNGGLATFRQTLFRPALSWNPYRTPVEGLYLCSSSTPPGGGVHGMCGSLAAQTAIADLRAGSQSTLGKMPLRGGVSEVL
jgi:phytoene dehydrogenase-like protein